jgi:hypothetical protein
MENNEGMRYYISDELSKRIHTKQKLRYEEISRVDGDMIDLWIVLHIPAEILGGQ